MTTLPAKKLFLITPPGGLESVTASKKTSISPVIEVSGALVLLSARPGGCFTATSVRWPRLGEGERERCPCPGTPGAPAAAAGPTPPPSGAAVPGPGLPAGSGAGPGGERGWLRHGLRAGTTGGERGWLGHGLRAGTADGERGWLGHGLGPGLLMGGAGHTLRPGLPARPPAPLRAGRCAQSAPLRSVPRSVHSTVRVGTALLFCENSSSGD